MEASMAAVVEGSTSRLFSVSDMMESVDDKLVGSEVIVICEIDIFLMQEVLLCTVCI